MSETAGRLHCHGFGDLVLNSEYFTDISIITFSPDVVSSLRIDKLRSNPNAAAAATYTTFNHVAYA